MNPSNGRQSRQNIRVSFIKDTLGADLVHNELKSMIGGTLNIEHVRVHWDEILRLATSIKRGTVTASLMLRKLGS